MRAFRRIALIGASNRRRVVLSRNDDLISIQNLVPNVLFYPETMILFRRPCCMTMSTMPSASVIGVSRFLAGGTDLVPLRATIGVSHVATPARWLDDASLCSCVFNLRQHQSAAAAPRTVLDFLIPNGLSYPETMIFSRNRLGRIDNSNHDRHRHKRDVPVMPFAEASPEHARAIAKRLRHDIRMHVTKRVAHIDIWG